jgi:hypothetical protein
VSPPTKFPGFGAVGQPVEVHSFGRWYPGTISGFGRTRLKVTYATGTGTKRVKAFPVSLVRAVSK